MSDTAEWVIEWEDGLEYVAHLGGVPWYDADPPPRRHTCRAQTKGLLREYVERCACGAFGPAPFFMLGRDKPRVADDPEPRRLSLRGLADVFR